MTVWYHQSTILKQRRALRTAGLVTLCVAFITTLLFSAVSHAATGINKTLSFQGRLQSSSGAIVADGYYNIQFKIYQDGSGTTAGNPDGTLKWTESYINNGGTSGVQVKNGYFSVTLGSKTAFGSSVDWNQDTLWLSMNIAGTASTCTTFGSGSCTADGEMLPMKRLTSTPYALNAGAVGGLTSSDLIHNQNTAQQTTSNFWISGTGRADTALQAPVVDTATAGTLTIGGTNATSITMADDVTVAAGKSLTLAGGNTASRPASPTEGMLYYDTSTKQLLVYSDGKWKSDGKTATKIVAASDSSQALKDGADYVADGTSDQTEINSALTAAAGGSVYLAEGTYVVSGSISVPNNTTLSGAGKGTVIEVATSTTGVSAIVNSDTSTGTGVTITDLTLDGRSDSNPSGNAIGVALNGMGSNSRAGGTITNIKAVRFGNAAIRLSSSYSNTLSNNTINDNATGILLNSASQTNTISQNSFTGNSSAGVYLSGVADNMVSNNQFINNGGSATNNAIYILSADSNTITNNTIKDSSATTTNYAINVSDSGADTNYIADNSMANGSINDAGTGTIFSSQLDNTGKLINKSAGGSKVQTSTNTADAFTVQNAAGTSALSVNTSTNAVLVAGTIDTTTTAALSLGSTNATSITIGNSSSNIATTVLGTALFKPTTGNDSTTAFQVQRANGTAMFTIDTTNQTITFGNPAGSDKLVISTATGQLTKSGSARNSKKIALNAEYTGSVLDAGSGSNNSGTMTSSVDLTNRMNYYKWTTTQGSNQSYDVVVQVPIPNDFDGWDGSTPLSISTYTSNTTNGTITLEARDATGTVRCNFVSVTPGSTGTWSTNSSACTLSSGTYTPGDYLTLRVRMQSPNGGDVRIGNINLNYLSKY